MSASLRLLTCRHAGNLWGAVQCRVAVVTGLDRMCDVTKRRPKAKFIGNDRKSSEMIGNCRKGPGRVGLGQVTSATYDVIPVSSNRNAKMRKYANRELWSSSPSLVYPLMR